MQAGTIAATEAAPIAQMPPASLKMNGGNGTLPADMSKELGKDLERLNQMGRMGKQIEKQRRALDKLESAAAEAESNLKTARADRNAAEHVLHEMLDDLAKLANGNFIERLPFKSPEEKPAEAADTSWRSVELTKVWEETGAPVALLNPLRDGKVKWQNDPAGITTLGKLADFTFDHRLTDIAGLGKGKAEQIEAALDKWWAKHPQPKAETTAKASETVEVKAAEPAAAEKTPAKSEKAKKGGKGGKRK